MLRSGNKAAAAVTLLLDALKGCCRYGPPTNWAGVAGFGDGTLALVGLAAFIGHLFPVFFKFKGGTAHTAAGVLFGVDWLLGPADAAGLGGGGGGIALLVAGGAGCCGVCARVLPDGLGVGLDQLAAGRRGRGGDERPAGVAAQRKHQPPDAGQRVAPGPEKVSIWRISAAFSVHRSNHAQFILSGCHGSNPPFDDRQPGSAGAGRGAAPARVGLPQRGSGVQWRDLPGGHGAGGAELDIRSQTANVLAQIDQRLAEAGSDKTRSLRVQIYLSSIADIAAMNAVWDAWVPAGHAPPRATVEARLAHPDWKIEKWW